MEKSITQLENENEKLISALKQVSAHMEEINKILESVSDLISSDDDNKAVTDDDVKKLLKKYSKINSH